MAKNDQTADHPRTMFPVGFYDHDGSAQGDALYFITNGTDACKIGRTRNLQQRVGNLQHANPRDITVELTLPGMGWQERVWHAAFDHLNLRGEWFRCDPQLDRAIEAARAGDEWIATLTSPFANTSDHRWRDIIADREENAICALEADQLPARLNQMEQAA